MKTRTIIVKGAEVAVATRDEQDYISLTDMLRHFGGQTSTDQAGNMRDAATLEQQVVLSTWKASTRC